MTRIRTESNKNLDTQSEVARHSDRDDKKIGTHSPKQPVIRTDKNKNRDAQSEAARHSDREQ